MKSKQEGPEKALPRFAVFAQGAGDFPTPPRGMTNLFDAASVTPSPRTVESTGEG